MLRMSPRATMPSPPAEKSICWQTTGTVRGIFDQFGREERDHVERAPEDMALAAGEKVARFDRVIDDRELHVEADISWRRHFGHSVPCRCWRR